MAKIYYQVRMELRAENEIRNAWQDWGGSNDANEATETAQKIQKEIDEGKWDNRKQDGCTLQMCVEELDDETFDLLSIIEV